MPPLKLNRVSTPGWAEHWEVESHSNPSIAYIVSKKSDGTWGCSCPHWTHHVPRPVCKHIREVLQINGVSDVRAPITTPEKLEKILSRFSIIEF
jgi:hypothetical protein